MEATRTTDYNNNNVICEFDMSKIGQTKADELPFHIVLQAIIDHVIATQHFGTFKTKIELPRVVVVGDQSSGKSSFDNAILAHLLGIEKDVFPTAKGACTMVPIGVTLTKFPRSEKKFELFSHVYDPVATDDVDQVKNTIAEAAKTARKQISLEKDKIMSLVIGADRSFQIFDTPGLRGDSYTIEQYFAQATQIDEGDAPVLVFCLDADKLEGDVNSGTFRNALLDAVKNNTERWAKMKVFAVVTHSDTALEKGYAKEIVESSKELKKTFTDLGLSFSVGLVQLKIKDKESTHSEIRKAERKLFEGFPSLAREQDARGDSLFVLGIENVADALVTAMGDSIIKKPGLLEDLFVVTNKEIEIITEQLKLVNGEKSPFVVGRDLQDKFAVPTDQFDHCKLVLNKLAIELRRICEHHFANSWLRERQSSPAEVQITDVISENKNDKAAKDANTWREALRDFVDALYENSDLIADMLLGAFSKRLDGMLSAYRSTPKFFKKLHGLWENFFREEGVNTKFSFRQSVKEAIRKKKVFLYRTPNYDPESILRKWGEDSLFVNESKVLVEMARIRDPQSCSLGLIGQVLVVLDTTLRDLETQLIELYVSDVENAYISYLEEKLRNELEPVREITPEQKKELEIKLARYNESISYINSVCRRNKVVISRAEEEEKDEEYLETMQASKKRKGETSRWNILFAPVGAIKSMMKRKNPEPYSLE